MSGAFPSPCLRLDAQHGPSVTRHTNAVPRAGLQGIPRSCKVLCLLCTGGAAWKQCSVCSEIRAIVHRTEKRYRSSSPLQRNCPLQLSLLLRPLLSHDCLVSLGGNWDFPNQPVKVETMNNSVTKHVRKEEQASTCREELCMQLRVHSALLPKESSRDYCHYTHSGK